MIIRTGMENGIEGRSLAWALDHPGCFAYGKNAKEALANLPHAVLAYKDWIDQHTADSWLKDLGDFDIRLMEAFECYTIDENFEPAESGYEVNAWFRHDWKPLTRLEVQRGLLMLDWSRTDLLALVKSLADSKLDADPRQNQWSIRRILTHVANAEWWYLDRLDLARISRKDLPEDYVARLQATQQLMVQCLKELEGVTRVAGKEGEFWSPRKILRRAVWHSRDHIDHIRQMLAEIGLNPQRPA